MIHNIAIDGPSGAGKSTLSKLIAKRYGLVYVDTGAMYRSIGLYVMRKGYSSKDNEAVECLLPQISLGISYDNDGMQQMLLNGENVSAEIRLPAVSIYASDVSAMKSVRAFLLEQQRELARSTSVVMDGRDIGTVVLPDAGLKIFLTASPEERAKRRYEELCQKGIATNYSEVLKDINYRDYNDSHREVAPLRPAEGAIIMDTTGNTLEQSLEQLGAIVSKYLGE